MRFPALSTLMLAALTACRLTSVDEDNWHLSMSSCVDKDKSVCWEYEDYELNQQHYQETCVQSTGQWLKGATCPEEMRVFGCRKKTEKTSQIAWYGKISDEGQQTRRSECDSSFGLWLQP